MLLVSYIETTETKRNLQVFELGNLEINLATSNCYEDHEDLKKWLFSIISTHAT